MSLFGRKQPEQPDPRPGVLTAGRKSPLEFDGVLLTIRRPFAGEKRIPVRQIQAVQWKEPSKLTNGWMEFTLAGSIERQAPLGKRTQAAMQNENAVMLPPKGAALEEFRAIREAIEQAMADL
jgi:hypothetical protein